MECFEFGFIIKNDKDDRLKESVNFVAGYDKLKANILAGYVNSQDFIDYCNKDEKFDKTKSLAENNQKTIRRLLTNYYRSKIKSVKESAAKMQAEELEGFSSSNAKAIAIDYTATIINNVYWEAFRNNNFSRKGLNRQDIIENTSNIIENFFINNIAKPIYKSLQNKDKYKDFAKYNNEYVAATKELKALNADYTNDKITDEEYEIKSKEINERRLNSKINRYNAAVILISEKGNVAQKNYMNLVERIKGNPNQWFEQAFNTSKLVSIVNEFKEIIQSDNLINENFQDENDYNNPSSDNIDESTKGWTDKIWASFDKGVAADLKLYFNSLYKMATPSELGSENYSYDTNNELGVPTTMGASFVISKLMTYGNFNSINDFIKSIDKMSRQIPELYGFIAIADRAIKDPVFANYIFAELSSPKIIKTIATITDSGVDMIQSNKSADALSYMVYNMMNTTRSAMTDLYTSIDIDILDDLEKRIKNLDENFFINTNRTSKEQKDYEQTKNDIEIAIYNILKKYYPKLNITSLTGYFYNDKENINKNIIDFIKNLNILIKNVGYTVEEYNDAIKTNSENRKKAKKEGTLNNFVSDFSSVNYDRLNYPIIGLAKALVNYTAVKNELNSINAEGNLSADVINNSWITNMLKQIAYGNEKDSEAGLNRLKDEILKGEQYKYNTLFWGVKDSNGHEISQGLFRRSNTGTITINPNARKIIQISLFNGIKDADNYNSAMYDRMSKGDYFLTNLYAYFKPIATAENLNEKQKDINDNYGGYFMRTPSDAPKNFIVQTPKLRAEGIVDAIPSSLKAYTTTKEEFLRSKVIDDVDLQNLAEKKITKYNILTAERIYNIINGNDTIFNYDNMFSITNEDGTITIPIGFRQGSETDFYWITGKKIQGETNNVLYDINFDGITSSNANLFNIGFLSNMADIIRQEGITNGLIETRINRNVPIFYGIRQNLLNELNTFIDQLNNVFQPDKKGNFKLRKDIIGLIDRAHYNITYDKNGNPQYLVQGEYLDNKQKQKNPNVGKLSGNFFTFQKLFEVEGFNVQEAMEQQLSLYGGGNASLIKTTKTSGSINFENGLVKVENNRLVLNISNELNTILDNITEQWINGFNKDVIKKSQEYGKILEDRFSIDQVFDFALNYANASMAFDDIFEGDVKFYKNARDFLKRAKEAQAGGKNYAGFDINDNLSEKIKNILDINGNTQSINIGDFTIDDFTKAYSPVKEWSIVHSAGVNARNGFRAITINNTVRPSKYANNIRKEVFDILKDKMSEEEATKIAQQIYKGFADSTKTNDAQSFITIEEFIRRRYADGTLHQYEDILKEIYDVRRGKKDIKGINLKGINARIQVQKNFYFDHHYDTNTRTHYPRQIKNAEFVLIPELLEGTDLKELYNIMLKYDIGQVNTAETSKAAKRNVLTFWDNEGNINSNFEADVIANGEAAIEDYYYRFLYKQQDVSNHLVDEHNKAGIQIMKKILDNSDDSVAPYIDKFFENYCANIKEDFNKLIFNMGWKVNKDGSISNIEGTKELLNFTDFYAKARHEAQRLGLDPNFIEYITPDELGNPTMPNYMNNVSSKLESIAQAIFNSSITRQTLPGWHAAQVTQIGHGMKVLDSNGKLKELKYHPEIYTNNETGEKIQIEDYEKLSNEEKNKYTKTQEAYAEVMIPRWSNLIPKDYDIKKLEQEGLDIQIAYRIPTEGKQSVSIVKVVGFLDDVYGSTIMLPDEWVTQTGSDFDVDSVYAICYEMRKHNDTLYKITEKNFPTDASKYYKYITDNLKNKIDDGTDDVLHPNKYKKLLNRLKKAAKEKNYKEINKVGTEAGLLTFNEFNNLDEVDKLPRAVRNNNILDAMIAIMKSNNSREENYSRSNFDDITDAMKEMNEARGATKEPTSTYNVFDQINFMENATSGASLKAFSVTRDTFNSINNKAKSYLGEGHHFIVEYNLQEKDNNGNYIYNYETIDNAYGIWNKNKNGDAIAYDRYNKVIARVPNESDENYYKRLKEQTVKVRVKHYRLGNSNNNRNIVGRLLTVYSSETTAHILDAIKEGAIYNENTYTFGTFKTLIDTGVDYRTAIAFLMQPGISIINEVNNETNSIYINGGTNVIKTAIKRIAANAGYTLAGKPIDDYSDYDTVINLLNTDKRFQNAISELFGAKIDYNNSITNILFELNATSLKRRLESVEITNNSELSQEDKIIRDAAFDIAIVLTFNKINRTTKSLEKIMRCCNPDSFGAKQTVRATRMIINNIREYGFSNNYLKDKIVKNLKDFGINVANRENCIDYINNTKYIREAVEDIYNYIIDENNSIEDLQIDENTRKKVNDMLQQLHDEYKETYPDENVEDIEDYKLAKTIVNIVNAINDFKENPVSNVVRSGEKNLLKAIYPGFDSTEGIQIKNSVYPYLASFLKYATNSSVDINSMLFPTESNYFNKIVDAAQQKLGIIFTDEQYKEFKQYIISKLYSQVPYLNSPLTITKEGWINYDEELSKEYLENGDTYWNAEVSRIFGYNETENTNIEINDIYSYEGNEEAIKKFNKLTPVQKILWIQTNCTENRGIFDYININKIDVNKQKDKGYNQQTIRFTDSSDNMQEVYMAFNNSFYNKSPFIRLATIDLIKYAFIVEGFKFKKGGISKVITNNSMYKNIEDMGMNIIPVIRELFQTYFNFNDSVSDSFINNFARSHSEYIRNLKLGKAKTRNGSSNIAAKFNKYLVKDGLVFIPFDKSSEDLLNALYIYNINDEKISKSYVRITRTGDKNNSVITLYKIDKRNNGVYLIPLNTLERNETGNYSVNASNNKFADINYYTYIIDSLSNNGLTIDNIVENENKFKLKEIKKENTIPKFKFHTVKESVENPNEFKRILTNGNEKEKGELNKFISRISDYITSPVEERGSYILVWSNSNFILNQVPEGKGIVQNIPINGETYTVRIQRTKGNKKFIPSISKQVKYERNEIPVEQWNAYEDAFNAKAIYSNYYKVTLVVNEDIKNQVEKAEEENENDNSTEMAAITNDITDFYNEEIDKHQPIDTISKLMLDTLKVAERQGDASAEKARRAIELKGINENRSKDLINNRKSIYSIMAQYIELYTNTIEKALTEYNIDDDIFNIGDDKLYTSLLEHPEEVENVVKLLLESATFGGKFGDIMSLPLEGLDTETTNAIKRIRNCIIKIRNHESVKRGFDKMFNIYIANKYSTNPIVRTQLVNLNTTFGDAGWWESWIGDTAMISNKQIQTVVKIVNNIMYQAAMDDAPKAKNSFIEKAKSILNESGSFNWNNVIDNQGRVIRPYTAKFIEDRKKVTDAVQEAREIYGIDSLEYINAKLERDEWYAKNVHQLVDKNYYIAKNANVRYVLEKAPKKYLEYMKLIHKLYNDSRPNSAITKEERDRRKEIQQKINRLTSIFKDDDTLKSEEDQQKAKILKNFIDKKRRLEKEYFNWDEAYGFQETLKNKLFVIKQYEKEHPNETLDIRLNNDDYRDAYEWIQYNTHYILDEEANEAINKAFSILKDKDNVKSKKIKEILNKENAYDEFGNIDARKLSDKSIQQIKDLVKHKYDFSYDSNAGEAILIKDIPSNLPIFTDEFYRMLRDESENKKEINPERLKIIARINELLNKSIGEDGRIHAKDIFENLNEDELEQLAEGYRRLKNIKGNRMSKKIAKKFAKYVEFKTNDTAFNEEYSWAITNLGQSKRFNIFVDIFVQTDKNGEIQLDDNGNYIPNNDIYGFIVPKDDKYIDKEKTEARKLIEDNLEFVPNEYYYAAIREATEKGEFKEWFQRNHIYNPYKHKFEPLRIWTAMKVNPNASLKGSYSYVPTFENQEKNVNPEHVNTNYNPKGNNYNQETGEYNNYNRLSPKEKQMQELLQNTLDFFAKYNKGSYFIEQGFVPRKRKIEVNAKWIAQQAIGGVLGLEYRNDSEDISNDKADYLHDRNVNNDMFNFIKGEGYKQEERIRNIGENETPEEYKKYLKDVKERNAKIRKNNLKIDNALMNKDYITLFSEAIQQQVINNARNKAKNWLYLLQEDLKMNEAYKVSSLTGDLISDKSGSTDTHDAFRTVKQNRSLESIQAFTRRVIFDQFKDKSKLTKYADLARNITSAKYMIFNLTGGIANVGTGFVNIMGEAFAEDNFTKKDLREAVGMYLNNSISMLTDMYKEKSNNFAVALTKYFDVVDFASMTERVSGETAGEYARRMRNMLYGLQSGGEHFMQNAVLFAVLKQSKVFNDVDGTTRCGNFQNYIWKTEYDTLVSIIAKNQLLMDDFKEFKRQIKADKKLQLKYDTFKRNIVEEFLRAHGDKKLIDEYIIKRKEAIKKAKEEWNKKSNVLSQLDVKNGEIIIIPNSEVTKEMLYEIKNTVIALNKKIHGVYDKIGAARIEFSWYGGLVMQYHKHLYPGIMKRFRWKGYYNEQTNTIEIGSYAALVRFLGREYKNIGKNSITQDADENKAINSVRQVMRATIDTIVNIRTNWNLMPEWERNAVKRNLGDLYGIVSAILLGMAIYAMTDDDDEKNNEFVATALYISDRLLSEAQMYTPWGAISEASTLWSSPIAATNGPEDLLKGIGFLAQWMFDEDYDPNYKTGIYAKQNKAWVMLKRNIPMYRVYDRLNNMTKNNSYYRINEKSLNMKFAKSLVDEDDD